MIDSLKFLLKVQILFFFFFIKQEQKLFKISGLKIIVFLNSSSCWQQVEQQREGTGGADMEHLDNGKTPAPQVESNLIL